MAQPSKQPTPGLVPLGSETFAGIIVVETFLFFRLFFIDSFFKIYCGGASLEDRTVCQLTQYLVEFYHLLYSEPRFPSQEALDRPLFFFFLSLSLSLSLKKQKTQAEGGD